MTYKDFAELGKTNKQTVNDLQTQITELGKTNKQTFNRSPNKQILTNP